MEIYTSYFARIKKLPANIIPISIALFIPKSINLPSISDLYPTKEILQQWKNDNNSKRYALKYKKDVLNKLNPDDIVEKIRNIVSCYNGDSAVLVCYEKSSDFCHRHLVAEWLTSNGYTCREWSENLV